MDGYILTETDREKIPGAEDKAWSELERDYRLLRQEGDYVSKILQR